MMQTIVTDTTKECPPQSSTTTGAHYDDMRIFVAGHFTDRFSRSATFFLEQLVIKLSKHNNTSFRIFFFFYKADLLWSFGFLGIHAAVGNGSKGSCQACPAGKFGNISEYYPLIVFT